MLLQSLSVWESNGLIKLNTLKPTSVCLCGETPLKCVVEGGERAPYSPNPPRFPQMVLGLNWQLSSRELCFLNLKASTAALLVLRNSRSHLNA